jgi:polar amino acid transport system substrate-binding protein
MMYLAGARAPTVRAARFAWRPPARYHLSGESAEVGDDHFIQRRSYRPLTTSLQRRTFNVSIAALGLAALLTAKAFAAAQALADIKKRGQIRVGLLVDFSPYGTTNSGNQPDGYDADVARLLAKELGVKLSLVPVTGPNRIALLLSGKVDLLIASLVVTPERAKQVAFSRPYSAATIILYGRKTANIKSAADLKKHRIGVARGGAEDMAVTSSAAQGTEIHRFDDDVSAMQALISGQVDAIGCSTQVAAKVDKRAPGGRFEDKFVLRQQEMAIAVRPDQDDLLKMVNDFVARNMANGELNQLYRKWLERDLPAIR